MTEELNADFESDSAFCFLSWSMSTYLAILGARNMFSFALFANHAIRRAQRDGSTHLFSPQHDRVLRSPPKSDEAALPGGPVAAPATTAP